MAELKGWDKLEEEARTQIETLANILGCEVKVHTKEKYGKLRVLSHCVSTSTLEHPNAQVLHDLIDIVEEHTEARSGHTCMECGESGRVVGTHWLYAACPKHTKPIDRPYGELVDLTWKSSNLPTEQQVLHAIMGLVGEASEVMEHIKKVTFYPDRKFDRQAVVEELGDVLYYYTKLVKLLDIPHHEVEHMNRKKLYERNQHLFVDGTKETD